MQKPTRILILGGGYVAVSVCRSLSKAIKRGEVEVTVVSRENYHVWHGYVSEMITGRIAPGQILSPARRIFAPAHVHVAEIQSIDLQRRRVVTNRHLDGRPYELEFDHVVLALGSAEHLDAYPGLREHGFRLKSYDDCFKLKNQILTMFELADIESDPEERRRMLTFFVAGGGYAGTELAGELADYVRLLTSREYSKIRREECRVVLVHPGETILPELAGPNGASGPGGTGHPRLVAYAERHLKKLGVEVMKGTRVAWASNTEVGLSNGQRIPTRTIVSAVGTKPPALFDTIEIPRGDRGRVVVENTLQVPGYDYVWSAGDCAAVPYPKGGLCPPVATFALHQGAHLGRNLLRAVRGEKLKPFRWPGLGQAVSIGGRTAVGELKGIELKGLFCWLMWRAVSYYYFPSWDRRLRLLADWLIWPLVGRDIVEQSVNDNDDYEISHHVFQPAEVILQAGEVNRYIYLITEGEVEVVHKGPDGEESVTLLGPGSHFGNTSRNRRVHETVRARTMTHAVTVRADQAHRLHHVLAPLKQVASGDPA